MSKLNIYRISSLRVIDVDKKVQQLNETQKELAIEKYQDKLSQYFVEVTYRNGMFVVKNNIEYYYACTQVRNPIINVGIAEEELELIKNHLLYRSKNEILNPMIAALIFQELAEICKLGQREISELIGKSQGAISNKKRLLKLPAFVQNELIKGTIKERHGRSILELSKLDDYELVAREVLQTILSNNLNVSQTVDFINRKLGKKVKEKTSLDIKHIDHNQDLKNPEANMIINYINQEIERTYNSIESKFPNLELVYEKGLDNEDFVFLVKMKGINK